MAARKTAAVGSKPAAEKVESSFSKEQLLASKHFQDRKDIVDAILSPDKKYTIKEVNELIENYMKGKVK